MAFKWFLCFSIAFVFLFTSCSQKRLLQEDTENTLMLYSWMSGSFSSAEQAAENPDYFNINLYMVPIWVDRAGYWLYVEQAMAENPEAPYRQRVYKIEKNGEFTWSSSVYTIKNEEDFVGKWKSPFFFNDFDEDILDEREGCAVILKKVEKELFKGSTKGKECESDLRGASYATSEVEIYLDRIISWDRGYDEYDKQVWGAESGGYVFKKL